MWTKKENNSRHRGAPDGECGVEKRSTQKVLEEDGMK